MPIRTLADRDSDSYSYHHNLLFKQEYIVAIVAYPQIGTSPPSVKYCLNYKKTQTTGLSSKQKRIPGNYQIRQSLEIPLFMGAYGGHQRPQVRAESFFSI